MTWGPGLPSHQTTLYFRVIVPTPPQFSFSALKISLGGISLPSSEGPGCGPGPGSPGREQVATEDTEQAGAPAVEVQGRQGAAGLGDQHQVGPAEAGLEPADRSTRLPRLTEKAQEPRGSWALHLEGTEGARGGAQTSLLRPPCLAPSPISPGPPGKD